MNAAKRARRDTHSDVVLGEEHANDDRR